MRGDRSCARAGRRPTSTTTDSASSAATSTRRRRLPRVVPADPRPRVLQRPVQIEAADAHRRRQAEQEARRDAEDQGEEQHLAVDGDVAEPRDARRLQPLNRAHRDGRQRDAGGAAEQREPDALGQQLANDPARG